MIRSTLLTGVWLGAIFLGAGSRVGMRIMAINTGATPFWTVEGTVAVIALGALTGGVVAAIFLLTRAASRGRTNLALVAWCLVCGALMWRGLNPMSPLRAVVFYPLLVAHMLYFHWLWRRRTQDLRRDANVPLATAPPTP